MLQTTPHKTFLIHLFVMSLPTVGFQGFITLVYFFISCFCTFCLYFPTVGLIKDSFFFFYCIGMHLNSASERQQIWIWITSQLLAQKHSNIVLMMSRLLCLRPTIFHCTQHTCGASIVVQKRKKLQAAYAFRYPRWKSASHMFVNNNISTFHAVLRL